MRQTSKDIPDMCTLKRNDTKELKYKTEGDSQSSRTNLWLPAEGRRSERDSSGVGDGRVHLVLFKMENPQGPLVPHSSSSSGNAAQCYVAAWMGGEFAGDQMHVCVWLGSSVGHLKRSQHR